MTKAQMIGEILQAARSAAIVQNKPIDTGDLFLTLAFRTDRQLREMCSKLNITSSAIAA